MARKKKEAAVLPGVPATVPKEENPFDFEYGDLVVQCKCGRTQVITKGIEKGLQLVITNKKASFIQLKCDECDAEVTLRLIEGVKPEPVINTEEKTDEVVQEESKQEQSL
jgi:hypothetical protein